MRRVSVMSNPPGRGDAAAASTPQHPHTNRLASSTSPYLLQHARNPVDWWEWGEPAFAAAREQGKPILLSSGYSACKWCHVFERESFADEAVAARMNEVAVCVKLDKEVRPDVDAIYMAYLTATTGGGGWPLTVFIAPSSGAPFFAGTYFPKEAFMSLLDKVDTLWKTRRADVEAQASSTLAQLAAFEEEGMGGGGGQAAGLHPADALASCAASLASRFDAAHGAFGGAPKFPRPAEIAALQAHRLLAGPEGSGAAAEAQAAATLLAWSASGVWDAVGGGLARYSVDKLLHIPHFEKMTYDAAQFMRVLISGAGLAAVRAAAGKDTPAVSTNPLLSLPPAHTAARLAATAAATAAYLVREMTDASGGVHAAQDAESVDPADGVKKEGWCFTWSAGELESALAAQLDEAAAARAGVPPADLAAAAAATPHASPTPPPVVSAFKALYGVRPGGNANRDPRSDPHGELTGRNVLYAATTVEDAAAYAGLDASTAPASLAAARLRLYVARSTRPPPAADDKVVAAWNGMAISALSTTGRALAGLRAGALGGAGLPWESVAGWPVPSPPSDPHALVAAAVSAAAAVKARLWDEASGRLARCFHGPASACSSFANLPPAVADDYAWMASACLDLAGVTGDVSYLE